MMTRLEIKTPLSIPSQMEFRDVFLDKTGLDLYDHIVGKKVGETELVYTLMDGYSELVLLEMMKDYSIIIISQRDCTEEILSEWYHKGRLEEFFNQFDLYDPEFYMEKFYHYNVGIDQVLDKISAQGIDRLDAKDNSILQS